MKPKSKTEANTDDEPKGAKDKEILATAVIRFAAAAEAEKDNRKNYKNDVEFSSTDDQWDAEVKRARGAHRPALTYNRLNGVIKQIIGDYRQHKLAIKVLPAGGEASEEMADIIAGIIRNIEQQSNADVAYATALECSARGGFGYFRILTEYIGDDVFDQDIVIRPIHNALTVYFDPSAKLSTREDAGWCFISEMVPEEQFKKQYPKASTKGFDGDDDNRHWSGEDGVRVAEYYEKVKYPARLGAFSNGMVMEIADDSEIEALAQIGITLVREREAERTKIVWRKMTASEILDEREFKTKYIPVVRVAGEEINVEGKTLTRSAIFYAKDAQRTYNYFKTVATETVALAPKSPWLLTPEQIEGLQDYWDNANTTPSPYLPYNPVPGVEKPARIPAPEVPVGEISMAMNASDDIKSTTGLYDASLGARGNETSGRAIVARQQEGDTATYIFIDNLKKGIELGGRIIIDLIRVVMDVERVVRTLDMEGSPQTEVVNEQKYDPITGITEILNNITVGKYDVVITTGPSFASRKQEGMAAITQLAQAYPPLMQIAGDLVVKSMDFPGSEEVAARLKRALPPQITTDPDSPEGQQMQAEHQAKQAQAEQAQQAMAQAHMQLEGGKIQAENARSQAQIVKAHADTFKAKTEAIKAAMPQFVM